MVINSSYYPIYYLCIVTAAVYYGPIGTLLWTALTSAAYCAYLTAISSRIKFELTPSGDTELTLRIVFFFIAAILVNNFVMENRRKRAVTGFSPKNSKPQIAASNIFKPKHAVPSA